MYCVVTVPLIQESSFYVYMYICTYIHIYLNEAEGNLMLLPSLPCEGGGGGGTYHILSITNVVFF